MCSRLVSVSVRRCTHLVALRLGSCMPWALWQRRDLQGAVLLAAAVVVVSLLSSLFVQNALRLGSCMSLSPVALTRLNRGFAPSCFCCRCSLVVLSFCSWYVKVRQLHVLSPKESSTWLKRDCAPHCCRCCCSLVVLSFCSRCVKVRQLHALNPVALIRLDRGCAPSCCWSRCSPAVFSLF